MSKRKNWKGDIHLRLGESLHRKLTLVTMLRKEKSISAYIRYALERMIPEDLKSFPSVKLVARPGSQIYSVEGKGQQAIYTPLTKTLGGERVWVVAPIGMMPRALGGGLGYLVDLTVNPGDEGFEGRDVGIAASDVLGGA